MQIFLKDYVLILSKYAALTMLTSSVSMSLRSAADNCLAFLRVVSSRAIALTTPTVSVSMSLSSATTNCFASLREVSGFTDFALTDKTVSTALRLDFVLRTGFIKSNRKSPIRRLGIRALSCDQQVHTTDQGPLLRYDLPCFNLQKICISTHRTKHSLPYLFPFCQGI